MSAAESIGPIEAPLESGIHELIRPPPGDPGLRELQDRFIENWAAMAAAFALDRTLGRVHALVYVSVEPPTAEAVSSRLGLPLVVCQRALADLVSYGAISRLERAEGDPAYLAELDGWTWFLSTLRERQRREFQPIREAARSVREHAARLAVAGGPDAARLRATADRIDRFDRFFGELTRALDALVSLGARPVVRVIKTVARLTPRG